MFSSGQTSFGSAVFKCLYASLDAPAEWKNVEFDWDNPPSGNQPAPAVHHAAAVPAQRRTTISTAEAAWQH
jgi:hypothetical protein